MLEFLTLNPEVFGLDISDLSLKIIKLKKKSGFFGKGGFFGLAAFGEQVIPPGIIREGEIKNEDSLVKVIKESLGKVKGRKLKTKHVVASLPEEKTFLQVIQMPRVSDEDLKSAVLFEAENYIPLPIEEVYLDYQIVQPVYNHLDHLDILIAALPKKIVDPYLSCIEKAGLLPKALEIESLATARALIKNDLSPFPVLLMDLGATRTSFIIYSGYSPRFTNSIPISSQKFTEAIAKNLNIDLKKAEELKIKYGLEVPEKNNAEEKTKNLKEESAQKKKIFESLIPILTDLVEQLKKCLSYYQTHASHEHLSLKERGVKKIFLSGGGANLKGLPDFLSLELKIPVELGNPWINILPKPLKEVPELPFNQSLRYTTALGLALRESYD